MRIWTYIALLQAESYTKKVFIFKANKSGAIRNFVQRIKVQRALLIVLAFI
jgi:hypothetical protein